MAQQAIIRDHRRHLQQIEPPLESSLSSNKCEKNQILGLLYCPKANCARCYKSCTAIHNATSHAAGSSIAYACRFMPLDCSAGVFYGRKNAL